jgi:hypothetical protein
MFPIAWGAKLYTAKGGLRDALVFYPLRLIFAPPKDDAR